MKNIKQAMVLFIVNVLSLPMRWRSCVVAVIGVAGVVAILMAIFSLLTGFEKSMQLAGSENLAIVMRKNADSEMRSFVSPQNAQIIADIVGHETSARELFISADIAIPGTKFFVNMALRGLSPESFNIRRDINLLEGRMFNWGTNEVVIGRNSLNELEGLKVGSSIEIGNVSWQIVGIFEDSGSIAESEFWLDALLLRNLFDRGYSSVRVLVEEAQRIGQLREVLENDARLDVKMISEPEYYSSQTKDIKKFIEYVGYPLVALMALGTLFVSLSSMNAAVASRKVEISTLQAIGFRPAKVCVAILLESVFLGLLGGILGALAVFVVADGYQVSTVNQLSFSQVSFMLFLTPAMVLKGLALAIGIGLLGGMSAVVNVLRMPIALALK